MLVCRSTLMLYLCRPACWKTTGVFLKSCFAMLPHDPSVPYLLLLFLRQNTKEGMPQNNSQPFYSSER